MRERELLELIYGRSGDLQAKFPQVVVGPGDDCAVVGVGDHRGSQVLLKTDQLIERRHYVPGTPLDLVARKAIARAISDIAAMAGAPLVTLAACALPHGFPQEKANELFEACSKWARAFGAPLVGGDIASFAEPDAALTLTITSVGVAHETRGPVLRSGAKPGDVLYITGDIGGSFDKATGLGKHLTFEPRVSEGRWLADTLGAGLHSMMDVSDGVGIDAGRMAQASGVQIELDVPREVLNHRVMPQAQGPLSRDLVLRALSDGEDYELLFAVDPELEVARVCPVTGTAITRIGVCIEGGPAAYLRIGGERIDVTGRGWEHQ